MSKRARVGDRVEVTWVDSTSRGKWETQAELKRWAAKSLTNHHTCGYLLHIGKAGVGIVQSMVDYGPESEPMAADIMLIPRVAVRKIKVLM